MAAAEQSNQGGTGDVFWFDRDGNVVAQFFITWTGKRPDNLVLTDEQLEKLPEGACNRSSCPAGLNPSTAATRR